MKESGFFFYRKLGAAAKMTKKKKNSSHCSATSNVHMVQEKKGLEIVHSHTHTHTLLQPRGS